MRTSPWPAGTPCRADVCVPDVPAAAPFCKAVLNWDPEEPEGSFGHLMARVGEHVVARMGTIPDVPSVWTRYLASDDVDATVSAVTAAGGPVHQPAVDVGPAGRRAIVADPSGAVLGGWQAGTTIGARLINAPGAPSGEDLRSTDPAAAQASHRVVFGFRVDPREMAGPDYRTFAQAGEEAPLGGWTA